MKSKKNKPPMVAVDLGGTNLRIGLVTAKGQVVARSRSKMRRVTEGDGLRDLLSDRISAFIERKGIGRRAGAVTIGFAGPTDSRSGRIYFAPNVGRLSDIRLAESLKTRLGMEVFVANDADCAALGEFWQGAGRGASSLFLFTLGTGMGGAMVIGGDLWEGSTGIAGEIGHTVVDIDGPECACGRRGCLEALVSATAIVREYRTRRSKKPETAVLTAKDVFRLARQGDRAARAVVADAARALGVGIANVYLLLNPEMILIGGGVARAGASLIDPAFDYARTQIFPGLGDGLKVRRAVLGDDGALIGAAYLAYQRRQ